MPEHIHLLTTEPAQNPLATFLLVLKQRTSRTLKPPTLKQFWLPRYYDFNVSTNEKHDENSIASTKTQSTEGRSPSPKSTDGAASTITRSAC